METRCAAWHVGTKYDNLKAPGRLSPEPTWRMLTWAEKALVGQPVQVTTNVIGTSFSPTTRLGNSFDFSFDLQPAHTPEPASIFLLGSGLVALAGGIRRRSRTNCP